MGQGRSEAPNIREDEALAQLQRNDLDVRRRRAVISVLGQVGSERSINALRDNLYQNDLKTKVEAVLALARIASDEAVDALSEFLRKHTGPPFALAVNSLRIANAHRVMPTLIEILQERRSELSDGDKRVIIHALAHVPHRSQVPALSAALNERSLLTKRVAAMALSGIRAPESRTALQDAAQSLSWLGGLYARRELRRCQNDDDE
ncbi:MAG: HEAT repeat domain-containing protein [Solirubrobacterales bacterium]|nr:HEAT repeat domain-containing protein [Solirubrobacterales bacterium]